MTDDDLPTPGPTEPVPTWPEFEALRDAVEQYLQHDPPDPTYTRLSQALGAILGEHSRETFMDAHGLSEPAETACLARLIDGRDECPHNVVAQDDDPNAPPHAPPGDDHSTLWLDEDGTPAVYGIHVYQGNIEMRATGDPADSWFSILEFARHYGLGPRWRVRVYLERHGSTPEADLLDELSGERWTRDTLRQAVAVMVQRDHAERYDPRHGPELLRLTA